LPPGGPNCSKHLHACLLQNRLDCGTFTVIDRLMSGSSAWLAVIIVAPRLPHLLLSICTDTSLGSAVTLAKGTDSKLDSTRMRSAPRQKNRGRSNMQLNLKRSNVCGSSSRPTNSSSGGSRQAGRQAELGYAAGLEPDAAGRRQSSRAG
jgi:hypothetical protein